MIVAALFEPYPLWQAAWEEPGLKDAPLASIHRKRVVHALGLAKRTGITAGMSLAAAEAKRDDLRTVPAASPYLQATWEALVEEISGLTRRLETPGQGRLFLELEPPDAVQLAQSYGVRAGGAASVEMAHVAALVASPGALRVVAAEQEEAMLDALPVYVLKGLGLTPASRERLAWLGIHKTGQLRTWKKAQLGAYLGKEAVPLLPYLYGPRRSALGRYTLPPAVTSSHAFGEPTLEPFQIAPVLEKLAQELVAQLAGRVAYRLTVVAEVHGLALKATRLAKEPLKDALSIVRLALLTLDDTRAPPLGVETLSLELGALSRPSRQGSLWSHRESVARAAQAVCTRFPGALLRVEEIDPHALIPEHRYRLVTWDTAEEVHHEIRQHPDHRPVRPSREPVEA